MLSFQKSHRSNSQPQRDRRLPLLLTAATLTAILALRPDFAANIPWQTIAGCALLFASIGGAVASAMRTGDLYAATLARSTWPGKHDDR
ncbi:MAG: hypothetical protein ABIQ10_14305 [Gemmatimonadaceae bacterium]